MVRDIANDGDVQSARARVHASTAHKRLLCRRRGMELWPIQLVVRHRVKFRVSNATRYKYINNQHRFA